MSLWPRLYWTRDKNTKSSNTTKRKKFDTWRRGWPTPARRSEKKKKTPQETPHSKCFFNTFMNLQNNYQINEGFLNTQPKTLLRINTTRNLCPKQKLQRLWFLHQEGAVWGQNPGFFGLEGAIPAPSLHTSTSSHFHTEPHFLLGSQLHSGVCHCNNLSSPSCTQSHKNKAILNCQ